MNHFSILLVVCTLLSFPTILGGQTGAVTFQAHPLGRISFGPDEIFIADFDQDGSLDFLVEADFTTLLFINKGDWRFLRKRVYNDMSNSVDIGDIDDDGDLDVYVAGLGTYLLKQDSIGEFSQVDLAEEGTSITSTAFVDLDQDGHTDLFWSPKWTEGMYWWRNLGDDQFDRILIDSSYLGVEDIVIHDAEGDGDLDLFTTEHHDSRFVCWVNDGEQRFSPHVISEELSGVQFVSGDLNLDGQLDFLTKDLRILLQRGLFEFETISVGDYEYTQSYDFGDLDLDGDIDIIGTISGVKTTLVYWENDGSFHFREHQIESYDRLTVSNAKLGDFDQDGDLDIITTSSFVDTVTIWENKVK